MKRTVQISKFGTSGTKHENIMCSFPRCVSTPETRTVNLTSDGVECIPEFGEHKYKRYGGNTVPHVHPGMIEIICCRRGADLSFNSAGDIVPFRPGSVFAAQPETPHSLRLYPKSLSTVWIWFRIPKPGKTILGLSSAETEWLVGKLRSLPVSFAFTEALGKSFRRLWHLYDDAPRGTVERRLLMRDAATRLLLDIVEASAARVGEQVNVRLGTLIDEMRRDPSRDYTIDELADRAAMSVAKLTACFRRETGLPPHAFLVFCRMAKAKELLSTTTRSVGSISHELGFPTAQHFAAQFHREVGKSPLEFRVSK